MYTESVRVPHVYVRCTCNGILGSCAADMHLYPYEHNPYYSNVSWSCFASSICVSRILNGNLLPIPGEVIRMRAVSTQDAEETLSSSSHEGFVAREHYVTSLPPRPWASLGRHGGGMCLVFLFDLSLTSAPYSTIHSLLSFLHSFLPPFLHLSLSLFTLPIHTSPSFSSFLPSYQRCKLSNDESQLVYFVLCYNCYPSYTLLM